MPIIVYNLWSIANCLASGDPRPAGSRHITPDELLEYYSAIVGAVGRIGPKRPHYLEAAS